jgi:hypothetical protein
MQHASETSDQNFWIGKAMKTKLERLYLLWDFGTSLSKQHLKYYIGRPASASGFKSREVGDQKSEVHSVIAGGTEV